MTGQRSNIDTDRLLRDLSQSQLSAEEEQWLQEQLRSEGLRDGLWALGAAVFSEKLHQACEALLPDYVHLEALGQDAAAEYPRVKAHLDHCARCMKAYEELYAMVSVAYADDALDWSLVWETVAAEGRQVVARLFTEIRVLVAQGMASFGELPAPLAPAWATVPITRGEADSSQKRAQTLPLNSPEHDLSIGLTIGPISDDLASLAVQVTRASSKQPLDRVRVTVLDQEERRILLSSLTHKGQVTFSRLRSGAYVIEIRHAGKALELPMTFTWQE